MQAIHQLPLRLNAELLLQTFAKKDVESFNRAMKVSTFALALFAGAISFLISGPLLAITAFTAVMIGSVLSCCGCDKTSSEWQRTRHHRPTSPPPPTNNWSWRSYPPLAHQNDRRHQPTGFGRGHVPVGGRSPQNPAHSRTFPQERGYPPGHVPVGTRRR